MAERHSIYQTCYVTNAIVRQTTSCCLVSHHIQEKRLRFFGHVWHVLTFSGITIGLLRSRSDHPVIGEDLVDANVPPG